MDDFLLGYDVGSSSIKAALMNSESGETIASATSPSTELKINAKQPGWAEQDPRLWWEHIVTSTQLIAKTNRAELKNVKAIGISYQMHGLVMVDKNKELLYPSIIWCDSRAVETGDNAFIDIGKEKCLQSLLNSPGNFTASKLKWIKDNEPEIFKKIYKIR